MAPFRSQLRVIRHLATPIKNQVRLLLGRGRVQRSAPLLERDRTPRRRRAHVLVDLIHRYIPEPGAVIVEVGSVGGGTSAHIARYCPQVARLYAVDIAKPDPSLDETQSVEHLDFVHMDSVKAACQFDDASVDLVFIDADHSAQAVYADLEAWFPKVRPGGIVSGHDYASRNHPGVKPAVDFFFAKHARPPVATDTDKVWWTHK